MDSANRVLIAIILFLVLGAGGSAVLADSHEVTRFSGRAPTTEELIDALSPTEEVKFRGLRLVPEEESQPAAISLDIITFGFNSYELTDSGRLILDRVGVAFKSDRLRDSEFLIECHTDAVGGRAYNLELS